jgi:hypothetical protein
LGVAQHALGVVENGSEVALGKGSERLGVALSQPLAQLGFVVACFVVRDAARLGACRISHRIEEL